jgi:dedicator of cytokinesis protein 3
MLHGDANSLVHEHPPLLADVPLTRRLGFPDIVHPGVERHDLYIKLWSGSFASTTLQSSSLRLRQNGSSNGTMNVQITFELRKSDGSYIQGAMYSGGSGEPAVQQWHSTIYAQMDSPTYGELVRVQIPQDALLPTSPSLSSSTSDVHLFATFRNRSKEKNVQDPSELERPFAFAYLPLWGSDTVKDGMHDMTLHRWDGHAVPSPRDYLEPTRGTEDRASTANLSMRDMGVVKDKITVRTSLVSTSLSQDDTLSELFDWHVLVDHPDPLADVLRRFAFSNEYEIGKFLPRVLDALFGIMTSDIPDEQETSIRRLVCSGLIKVLLMSGDRRFPNFLAVLDIYIAHQYAWSGASQFLLDMMQQTMASANTTEYRSFLKVWHLFFRFIIRSREIDRSRGIGLDATSAHLEATFTRRVQDVLESVNRLMKRPDESMIGTKTLAVQHYADLLPSLSQVFAPVQLAEMVIAFTDTLAQVKGNLAVYKLLLVLQVVKEIFDAADARALLVPAIVRWVKPHLGKYMYDEAMLPDWKARGGERGKGDVKGREARKGKWLECARLAVTVSCLFCHFEGCVS